MAIRVSLFSVYFGIHRLVPSGQGKLGGGGVGYRTFSSLSVFFALLLGSSAAAEAAAAAMALNKWFAVLQTQLKSPERKWIKNGLYNSAAGQDFIDVLSKDYVGIGPRQYTSHRLLHPSTKQYYKFISYHSTMSQDLKTCSSL